MNSFGTVLFIVYLGVFLPVMAVYSAWLGKPLPPKGQLYRSVLVQLLAIGMVSLITAKDLHLRLFPVWSPTALELIAGAAFLLLWCGIVPFRWRQMSHERRRKSLRLLPTSRADLPMWFLVSLGAGVVEEIAYRGVMFRLLESWTSNTALAVLGSALLFTIVHAHQGWRGMLVVFMIALCLQAIVSIAGDLYVAMMVHFAYDFIYGLGILRVGKADIDMLHKEELEKAAQASSSPREGEVAPT